MRKKRNMESDAPAQDKDKAVVPIVGKGNKKLTSAQTAFNRLTRKIETLKENIREMPERERMIAAFYEENALPLFEKESGLRYDMLLRLDATYDTAALSVKQRDTLAELIQEECEIMNDLPVQEEWREKLEEIRDKYETITTGLSREERDWETIQEILEELPLLGISPDEAMLNARNMQEFIAAFEKRCFSLKMEKEQKKEEYSPGRKLTKKELRHKQLEEQTRKSVRDIYLELVKKLHPDKEADAVVREQKEEHMKRLTEAYRNKDLAVLLSMQMDWLESPVLGFNRQDDEVLKTYNKILRIQQKRLEEEYAWMCHAPFPAVMGAYSLLRAYPLEQLQVELDVMYESQFLEVEGVEDYIDSIATLAGLKRHLKQFAEDFADFGW